LDGDDAPAPGDEVLREAAAAGADVEGDIDVAWQARDQLRRDGLAARELIPALGLEVVHERPEQRPHDSLRGFPRRHPRHLVRADGFWQPRDVVDAEVTPAGWGAGDRFLVLHLARSH